MTTNEKGSNSPQSETQDKDNHFVSQYQIVYQSFLERPKTTLRIFVIINVYISFSNLLITLYIALSDISYTSERYATM